MSTTTQSNPLGANLKVERNDSNFFLDEKAGDLSNFPLSDITLRSLKRKGINYLFPIQSQTFNTIHSGKNLVAKGGSFWLV